MLGFFEQKLFKKFLVRFAIFLHIFQLIFKELFIVGTLEVYYENFHQIFGGGTFSKSSHQNRDPKFYHATLYFRRKKKNPKI